MNFSTQPQRREGGRLTLTHSLRALVYVHARYRAVRSGHFLEAAATHALVAAARVDAVLVSAARRRDALVDVATEAADLQCC